MKGQLAIDGQGRPFCPIRDCPKRCDQQTCTCAPCPPTCPHCRARAARLRKRLRQIRAGTPQRVDVGWSLPPAAPRQPRLFPVKSTTTERSR